MSVKPPYSPPNVQPQTPPEVAQTLAQNLAGSQVGGQGFHANQGAIQNFAHTQQRADALASSQVQDVLNKLQTDYVEHASTSQLQNDIHDAYTKFQAQTDPLDQGLTLEQFTSFAQSSAAKPQDQETLKEIFANVPLPANPAQR